MSSVRFRQTTILDPASVAPYGSEAWALECKKKLEEAVDRAVGGQLQFDRDLREFWEHQGWKALKNGDGQTFQSFREFARAPRPYGLHIPPKAYRGLMRDIDRAMEEIVEDAKVHPLNHKGRRKKDESNKLDIVQLNDKGGNSADHLARHIARDRPDILEKMKAGDYTSVRQAARVTTLGIQRCLRPPLAGLLLVKEASLPRDSAHVPQRPLFVHATAGS